MNLVAHLILSSVAVFITSYILTGVTLDNYLTAIVVAVVLGVVNVFLKPLLIVLTIPVTIITLGLFIFVINAVLILLVAQIVPGFDVDNFWWALLFSLVLTLVSSFLNSLAATAS